ncbi:C-type LECtin [Caenorhabditis elegans]|uniref:C-type LECtin n=1 Tax=Caenorhabditis elegans TaxID=6239 RepID=O01823_CAEEL|nr:C-type LECtin [Caenorhabditis elegans]CCD62441.1 C-type LECtin [Caenorhabditis elegans]|eukprot:NP_491462.2 C-type LECtin [Caenorhabditis elegans]
MDDSTIRRRPPVNFSMSLRLIIIIVIMLSASQVPVSATRKPVMCLQCGGEKYEGSVRLSRDECCKATPIMCLQGQVCLRALVYSPYGNFFLSGCHPEEDHLSGCDFHSLPHNSSVHRCVCKDGECQNDFPGDCPINGITDITKPTITSTTSPPSSTPPSLISRNRTRSNNSSPRNRHHHNHSMTSSHVFTLSTFISTWVVAITVL